MSTIARPVSPTGGHTLRGIPVVLPNRSDPRLRVAAVIISLQVLGQVALNFKVSIAQILVSLGACAVLEMTISFVRQRAIVWPASALLTGNGVGFILRVAGTRHGDWWTLHGFQYFVIAGWIGLTAKYLLVRGDRHYYNPANLGLVTVLLVWGPKVFPQYFWWGPLHPFVVAALVVIVLGAFWVIRPIGMLPMVASFLGPFYLGMAVLALLGHCFTAVWHFGPVCGVAFWTHVCLSPELLIFVLYMMSDPRTVPRLRPARLVYGALTAALAIALIAPQQTEYGAKVGLLVSLTVVCSLVPVIEDLYQAASSREWPRWRPRLHPVLVAVTLIAVTAPLQAWGQAHDANLLAIERGITPAGGPTQ